MGWLFNRSVTPSANTMRIEEAIELQGGLICERHPDTKWPHKCTDCHNGIIIVEDLGLGAHYECTCYECQGTGECAGPGMTAREASVN